jgi:hypothetical protein
LSDRWQHEVAAYELDRLLDLRLVPVTVTRTIDREKGALQFWVDGLVSFKAIAREEAAIEGICDRREQTDAMNVFDVLIHNTDRTQENMTYEKATGRAVLIDHSRSFRLERGIPDALKDMRLPVSAEWRRRLAALEDAEVSQALRPYLHRSQVASLLARRNLLMEMGEAD